MSTPESHPEKFPMVDSSAQDVIDRAADERLEKLAAPLPDALIPDDPEERRKLLENMFKGAMACYFGAPVAKTVAEFEQEIDEHNRMINEGGPSNESQEPTNKPKE